MGETGLIMLGFGIIILGVIIFFLLNNFVAYEGWGLVFELTFLFLAISGGLSLMFYAKKMYIFMGVSGIGFGGLIVFQYVNIFKKTKGLKGKERQDAIIREQNRTGSLYLVGCDSVTEESDGYHYIMTIAWQEKDTLSYDDYYSGTLTMVSDEKYLEPGNVYEFDEDGMIKLGKDKYSSLNEGGADITGIEKEYFRKAGKSKTALMNTVMNVKHKQLYGTYAEGTILSEVEKAKGAAGSVFRKISIIITAIIVLFIIYVVIRNLDLFS